MKREVKRFTVPASCSDLRLDQLLPTLDTTLSRTFVRKLIDFGGVHVNGRRVRTCSLKPGVDDRVELFIDGLPFKPFVLQQEQVVYQDDSLLVINKPAGIDCQPTPSRYKGTIYAGLLDYLADPYRRHLKPSLGMVQRLDRDTSGLMVFSIHPRAHKAMTEQFLSRAVEKQYLALVAGSMPTGSGEIRTQLARNRATNLMKSVEKGGQEAITRYRTIHASALASVVEVDLVTGRSHQIRAHFSELGYPLLGDVRYGGPATLMQSKIERQMLHSFRISFLHPVSGVKLAFIAPLPDDMDRIVRWIEMESQA